MIWMKFILDAYFHNIGFLHQNENELDKSFGHDNIFEKKSPFFIRN